jgi:hypothetical protein
VKTAKAMRKRSDTTCGRPEATDKCECCASILRSATWAGSPKHCMLFHLLGISELFKNFVIMILVQETSRCCHQYYTGKGDDNNPAPQNVTLEEMYFFLALILKMAMTSMIH